MVLTLSIIIPCYNEEKTIGELLKRVLAVDLGSARKEVIVVNDGSQDRSGEIVREFGERSPGQVRLLTQPQNRGKGAAVWRGMQIAKGELIVVQDADLEYRPEDFRQMLTLFEAPNTTVVFGSRRLRPENRVSGLAELIGAQVINAFTNVLYGVNITDQFTCYKMLRRSLIPQLRMRSKRFEFDAELTAKLLRLGQRVQEVPIQYFPRSRAEGKKIRWRDGVVWLWQIIKHRFTPKDTW